MMSQEGKRDEQKQDRQSFIQHEQNSTSTTNNNKTTKHRPDEYTNNARIYHTVQHIFTIVYIYLVHYDSNKYQQQYVHHVDDNVYDDDDDCVVGAGRNWMKSNPIQLLHYQKQSPTLDVMKTSQQQLYYFYTVWLIKSFLLVVMLVLLLLLLMVVEGSFKVLSLSLSLFVRFSLYTKSMYLLIY